MHSTSSVVAILVKFYCFIFPFVPNLEAAVSFIDYDTYKFVFMFIFSTGRVKNFIWLKNSIMLTGMVRINSLFAEFYWK